MPFLEVFDFNPNQRCRERATRLMTKALCDSYEIKPEIVSAYFVDVGQGGYGHAGKFLDDSMEKRIFVKLHAFSRPDDARRKAAKAITEAVVTAYGAEPGSVAVYFIDRDPAQVSHAGILACD